MDNDYMYVGPYFQCDASDFKVDADDDHYVNAYREKIKRMEVKTACECVDPPWDMWEATIDLGKEGARHYWIEPQKDKQPNNERSFYYSCYCACLDHIDAEQVTREKRGFVERHQRDARLFLHVYGHGNVKVKWGIIHPDQI